MDLLLCIYLTTMELRKYGKENVLIKTDAFPNFRVAIVTADQQTKLLLRLRQTDGSTPMVYNLESMVIVTDPLTTRLSINCASCT